MSYDNNHGVDEPIFRLKIWIFEIAIGLWGMFWTAILGIVLMLAYTIGNHPPTEPTRSTFQNQESYDQAVEVWQSEIDQWEHIRPFFRVERD